MPKIPSLWSLSIPGEGSNSTQLQPGCCHKAMLQTSCELPITISTSTYIPTPMYTPIPTPISISVSIPSWDAPKPTAACAPPGNQSRPTEARKLGGVAGRGWGWQHWEKKPRGEHEIKIQATKLITTKSVSPD